jgi:ribosomal protein L7/L12
MDLYSSDLAKRLDAVAQAIARLERKTDLILNQLNIEYTDYPEDSIPPQLAEVYALLKQGKRLQAIQAYRKQTGAGLEEAKTSIESIALGLANDAACKPRRRANRTPR